jgi:hypothetical protein
MDQSAGICILHGYVRTYMFFTLTACSSRPSLVDRTRTSPTRGINGQALHRNRSTSSVVAGRPHLVCAVEPPLAPSRLCCRAAIGRISSVSSSRNRPHLVCVVELPSATYNVTLAEPPTAHASHLVSEPPGFLASLPRHETS